MEPEFYNKQSRDSTSLLVAARELFNLAQLEFALDEDSSAGCAFAQLGLWLFEVHLGILPSLAAAFNLPSVKVVFPHKGATHRNLR